MPWVVNICCTYQNKPNIYLNQLHTQPEILGSILKWEMYGRRHALVHHSLREVLQFIYTHGRAMAYWLLLQPGRTVSFLLQLVSLCPFCTTKVASISPLSFFFVYATLKVDMGFAETKIDQFGSRWFAHPFLHLYVFRHI